MSEDEDLRRWSTSMDLPLMQNWRGIRLLDISSKILSSVLVARMGELMKKIGMESQVGFRWDRGTIDGLFTTYLGLSKRKEHGLETWALFIDLVKAFDSVPREALFAVLRRLVAVMQRPRLRQCTFHRPEWRTGLRAHPAST